MNILDVKILNPRIGSHVALPEIMTPGSAGMDLRYCPDNSDDDLSILEPGSRKMFETGISIHIKNPKFAGFIFPRSSLGYNHGIILANSVGVIDSDYQGPLKVALHNTTDVAFPIRTGDRIAQLVIMPVTQCQFSIVSHHEVSERGEGGFGSTGVS